LRVPFNVTIDFVAHSRHFAVNFDQRIHDGRVIGVVVATKLIDQRDHDSEPTRDQRDND